MVDHLILCKQVILEEVVKHMGDLLTSYKRINAKCS